MGCLFMRDLVLLQQLLQILLRSRDWCNPEILHKVLQHIGRNKCRWQVAKANVLDAQIQQGQQDTHRLLLIPESTMDSGKSFTPQPNASASATAI